MIGRRKARFAASVAVVFALIGATPPVRAQDEAPKPFRLIEVAPKGGLDDGDRKVAAEFLTAHASAFPSAPGELAYQVRSVRQWSQACAPFAQRVPSQLRRQLSQVPEGTFRVIFDGALLVVASDTGRVIDRVEPER